MDILVNVPSDIALLMGAVTTNCVDRMFHSAYRGLREAAEGTEQDKQRRQAYNTATQAMLTELYRRLQRVEFETVVRSFEDFFATQDVADVLLAVAREGSYVEAEWLTARFHEEAPPDLLDNIRLDLNPVWREFEQVLIDKLVRLASEGSIFQEVVIARLLEMQRILRELHPTPPPSPTTPPVDRPPRAEHFTGREAELAWLTDALQPGRTVTLCAAGGMGKTALAAEALHLMAADENPPERFPDGVIYHNFYERPSMNEACQVILEAYGIQPPTDDSHKATYNPRTATYNVLRYRTALIVLDGGEQAEDLSAVRRAIPDSCGVLLTTRLHSQAPDPEWTFDLLRLQPESALALLREFAGDWARDEAAASRLCKLVGYLPLALRLAGRYLFAKQATAAEYAEDLEAFGLSVLELDAQHASESVPVLMRKSVEQVSDEARSALSAAGLLDLAPFDGILIAAALDIEPSAARGPLRELVDYGLLVRDAGDGMYTTGHALVHGYARTELTADDDAATHLAAYLTAQFREYRRDFALLDALRPHTLAILTQCLDLTFWYEAGILADAVIEYLDLQGHYLDLLAVTQVGLDSARTLNDRHREGSYINSLGKVYLLLGQTERAIDCYELAVSISRKIGDQSGQCAVLGNLGTAYNRLGQAERAIEFYEQALDISREIGARGTEGAVLGNLGTAYRALGHMEESMELYELALAVNREIGDHRGEATVLGSLGNAYLSLGQVERAIEQYEEALAISREIGDRRGESAWLGNLGGASLSLGEMERAIEQHEQALGISRAIGDRHGEGNWLGSLGSAYLKLGETGQAIEQYEQALAISREIGDRRTEGNWLGRLGSAFRNLGKTERAIEYYGQALAISRETGDRVNESNHLINLGATYSEAEQFGEAIEYLEQGLSIDENARSPFAQTARELLASMQEVRELLAILRDESDDAP